jgi:hypothetical protein
MRIATGAFLTLCILATTPNGAASAQSAKPPCLGSRDITSPDGALVAHVTRTGRGGCGESRVEILEADGHLRADADYTSGDGEHGEGVVLAAWSPDSRFFVYSLADAGDSAAVKYRIDFYRRDSNKVRPITVVAPDVVVAQPAFKFGEGDTIEVSARGGLMQLRLTGN